MTTASVGLIEDLEPHRRLLERAVAAVPHLQVRFSVGSLAEARPYLQPAPDLILVDLGLPDGRGDSLLQELGPETAVLVVTVFGDEDNVVRALERGARGYVLKDAGERAVVDAIISVLAGGAPLTPSVAAHLLKRFRHPDLAAPASPANEALTPREFEVLRLLARGFSYREAATHLSISPHTLSHYVKQIYGKLAVNSRGAAVFEAVNQGILRLD